MSTSAGSTVESGVFAARTDVGRAREHNEDSYAIAPPLFVVADGMGGHEAGEVASALAVQSITGAGLEAPDEQALARAVEAANRAVLQGAQDGTGKPGMGTTMTAALVSGDEVVIAQVGDSRAYLFHNGALRRITRDHSLVADLVEQGTITEEEARYHPQRSVITRALGSDPAMEPDLYTLRVEEGDRLMLCSDGLSSMIPDSSIGAVLATNRTPEDACAALVDEALAAGGLDNVTVIVVDPLRGDAARRPGQASAPAAQAEPSSAPADAEAAPDTVAEPLSSGRAPEPAAEDSPPAPRAASAGENRPYATPGAAAQARPRANIATARKETEKKARRKGRMAPIVWVVAFLLIVICACGGFYAYAQSSYYLISEDGYVTVYRGVPGELAGIRLSWLEQRTDIPADELSPTVASRLRDGISVDSLERANALIAEYHDQLNASSGAVAQDPGSSDSSGEDGA